MIVGTKGVEHWLIGLCGGLLVALSALFAASGWGVPVSARGMSPGALVFYAVWAACLGWSLVQRPRLAGIWMGYAMGATWWLAALGSLLRASAAMRWHPVVLGVNLVFCLFGVGCIALSRGLQRGSGGQS